MIRRVDYIIVGQGLAGSALAWELIHRDKSVMVFDLPNENTASSKAAGLYNPITGKGMSKAWKAEEVFPYLEKFYRNAEKELKSNFLFSKPIYRPYLSRGEQLKWESEMDSKGLREFVLNSSADPMFTDQVHNPFGGLEVRQSGYLDVNRWMRAVREFLLERNSFHDEAFREDALEMGEEVRCGDIRGSKIIFCTGTRSLKSRWFGWLPVRLLKGETLEVRMEFACDRIFNRGVYLVPSAKEKIYVVGSTYQHPPFLESTTPAVREELQSKLAELIKLPFDILHQDWGIRPSAPDRRPMIGYHPANKNVLIFNGLGTKGVSLAPYFACHLADVLEGKGDLSPEVNIYRFKALYSG